MPLTLAQLSFDVHLREERNELFQHKDTAYTRSHRRAKDDIVRDLQRHGFDLDKSEVVDDFSYATVLLTFQASLDGPLFVPSGTRVRNLDASLEGYTHGALVFETNEDLNVTPGEVGHVEATAEFPGAPYNIDPGELKVVEGSLMYCEGVTNSSFGEGGHDHQLTRAAVYRALSIIYMDLMRMDDDAFASAYRRYYKAYQDEVQRIVAAGVRLLDPLRKDHGMKRFERG